MTRLVFVPPGPDAPGYLRRQRQAMEFSQTVGEKPTPETLDKLVLFLAQFVTEPVEQDAKLEALWDASEEEFKLLLGAITGAEGDANPTK